VDCLTGGLTDVDTDHEKLLARLETELEESRDLVRLQQQMMEVHYTYTHIIMIIIIIICTFVSQTFEILLLSVCRTGSRHPPPLNWPIPTFWKSGNVFRCTGTSSIISGGLLKGRGSPSPTLPSD